MDDGFVPGILIGLLIALFAALMSYAMATDTIQQQAIAAKVGCWKIEPNGTSKRFVWADCQ